MNNSNNKRYTLRKQNTIYMLNPKSYTLNSEVYYNKHWKHIHVILDAYNIMDDWCEPNLSDCIYILSNYLKHNTKARIHFTIIRSKHQSKEVTAIHKYRIKHMCKFRDIPLNKFTIATAEDMFIKTMFRNEYIRICNIPNTNKADIIYTISHNNTPELRVAGFVPESIVDGPGFRYTIFTQGCYHDCEGCHNPQTHSPEGGEFVSIDTIIKRILENPMLRGITLSGGEPFLQAETLSILIDKLKAAYKKLNRKLDIMCYTGYTINQIEDIINNRNNNHEIHKSDAYKNLLIRCDYIMDGKFIPDKQSLECKWRGSSNQRMWKITNTDSDYTREELYPCKK